MKFNKIKLGRIFYSTIILIIICIIVAFILLKSKDSEVEYGASFSYLYAESLGLDWQEVYIELLDDLEIKKFRIPMYWSTIEFTDDEYDFSTIDWIMDEAESRNADVTLVVGQKVPRWPECFLPDWVENQSDEDREDALLDYISVSVNRYKNHPALERWQIENEAFFPFGECPSPSATLLNNEIQLVRDLDSSHQIQITTSGEQSFWLPLAVKADVLGVSLYRIVWHEQVGYFSFPLSPFFYKLQAMVSRIFAENVIISELQVEPWNIHKFIEEDDEGVVFGYEAFDANNLQENIEFAKKTGVDEIYFWGVEWWFYLRENGESGLWDASKIYLD